ncbi:hypothetical protein [Paenibacillus taichungensis]
MELKVECDDQQSCKAHHRRGYQIAFMEVLNTVQMGQSMVNG